MIYYEFQNDTRCRTFILMLFIVFMVNIYMKKSISLVTINFLIMTV